MLSIDSKLIKRLQKDGRASWAALGKLVDLTPPAVADRVRRLEERGVIRGYSAILDPLEVGAKLTAIVALTLDRPKDRKPFLDLVQRLPEIQECHHVAGDHDYLLKIRCADAADLERIISDELKSLSGVVRTHTTIVLSTAKETTALALRPTEEKPARAERGERE
ncbi:MAG: Lrp/AsnC family transcriptional regulator [Gemmatimonadaceae bacterium]|nr:Lrp/AsnC family transcriptional regulator [Gemmatimonadaceae bacterium]